MIIQYSIVLTQTAPGVGWRKPYLAMEQLQVQYFNFSQDLAMEHKIAGTILQLFRKPRITREKRAHFILLCFFYDRILLSRFIGTASNIIVIIDKIPKPTLEHLFAEDSGKGLNHIINTDFFECESIVAS